MSWILILRDLSQGAVQATVEDLKRWTSDEVIPVVRQTRQRVNDLLNKLNLGAIDFGVVKIRFSATAPPTAVDPNGSFAITPTGIYSRQAGAWVLVGGAVAAGLTLTTTEVNIGSIPHKAGTFNIASAGLTVGKPVLVSQANGPYTGKGSRSDEAGMDHLSVGGKVTSATNIECFWSSPTFVKDNFKFDWAVSA